MMVTATAQQRVAHNLTHGGTHKIFSHGACRAIGSRKTYGSHMTSQSHNHTLEVYNEHAQDL